MEQIEVEKKESENIELIKDNKRYGSKYEGKDFTTVEKM